MPVSFDERLSVTSRVIRGRPDAVDVALPMTFGFLAINCRTVRRNYHWGGEGHVYFFAAMETSFFFKLIGISGYTTLKCHQFSKDLS